MRMEADKDQEIKKGYKARTAQEMDDPAAALELVDSETFAPILIW